MTINTGQPVLESAGRPITDYVCPDLMSYQQQLWLTASIAFAVLGSLAVLYLLARLLGRPTSWPIVNIVRFWFVAKERELRQRAGRS